MSYSTSYRSINKLVINDLVFKTARALSLHFEKKLFNLSFKRQEKLFEKSTDEREREQRDTSGAFVLETHART